MTVERTNPEPRIGRLRAAWYVLMGQRVTPRQIQADWVEYQCIFQDLLDRWSAKLAREVKLERERIKRFDSEIRVAPAATLSDDKQELRRKVANMRGFGIVDGAHQFLKPEVTKNEPDS